MEIKKYLESMIDKNASDMFYRAGGNVRMRIDGEVVTVDNRIISLDEVNDSVKELTSNELKSFFQKNLDVDFGIYLPEFDHRFRVSIFIQRNWPALVIRNIREKIQSFEELNLPVEILTKLSMETQGLVLLTGSMGSGKSTAIASMVDNKVVKVTCRTCFSEHPYREGKVPPKKKPGARAGTAGGRRAGGPPRPLSRAAFGRRTAARGARPRLHGAPADPAGR